MRTSLNKAYHLTEQCYTNNNNGSNHKTLKFLKLFTYYRVFIKTTKYRLSLNIDDISSKTYALN